MNGVQLGLRATIARRDERIAELESQCQRLAGDGVQHVARISGLEAEVELGKRMYKRLADEISLGDSKHQAALIAEARRECEK